MCPYEPQNVGGAEGKKTHQVDTLAALTRWLVKPLQVEAEATTNVREKSDAHAPGPERQLA